MDDDFKENIQINNNEESSNSELQTRVVNTSQYDLLETDEHSLSGDVVVNDKLNEIIGIKEEQYSGRTSINIDYDDKNDSEMQEQETNDNDTLNITDIDKIKYNHEDEDNNEEGGVSKSINITEDVEQVFENLSNNGQETNRDEADDEDMYKDEGQEEETNGKESVGRDTSRIVDEEEETNAEEVNEEDTNREVGDEGEIYKEQLEEEVINKEEEEEGETSREIMDEGEIAREESMETGIKQSEGEEAEVNKEEGEEGDTNREEEEAGEVNKEEGEEGDTNREEEEVEGEVNKEEGEGGETNKEEEVEGDTNRGDIAEENNEVEGEEGQTAREQMTTTKDLEETSMEEQEIDTNHVENEEKYENISLVKEINNEDHDEGHFGINKANQIDDDNQSEKELNESNAQTNQKLSDNTNDRNSQKYGKVSNFFTAPVTQDDGSVKHQLVTIVRSKCKKQFLGGYRHKMSGIVYHHAAVQTMPKPRSPPSVVLFSRDTQTFQMKHQKINTDSTTSTQLTHPGMYVSNVNDKLLPPKVYETADEYRLRLLENIIIIQKYYRRWLAKQVVDEKRKQRDDRLHWEESEKDRKQKEKEERIQREYQRRMHPKTKADFDLLYSDLEKWREEQLFEINNSDITEAERKARKALLLEEETDLLAAIDRHKLDRKEETKTEAVQKMLSKAAAPKSWKDSKGRKIEMNTQFTIRSKELLEIFNSLNMQYLTSDERLDVLLTLKHTVKEHDCKLTKDIVDLVDREADLIMRNVKDTSLAGLRKRISTLFLQYCKTPTFNPQISALLKVPSDSSVLVGDVNYCKYCGRYLRSTEFSLSTKSSKLTICKSCARKDNQSRNRQDYSHYRRILKEIQMNEQEINDNSKVAFIFKQNDVKSLIESVWDGKSVISGCEDLDELMFMRWDFREHWTPWNTIFLTKNEAEAHVKVTDLSETYSNVLINRITQKHVIAKNLFGSLEKMIGDFQSKITNVTIKV